MLRHGHLGDVMADQEPQEANRLRGDGDQRRSDPRETPGRSNAGAEADSTPKNALRPDRQQPPDVIPADPPSIDRLNEVVHGAVVSPQVAETIREKIVPQLLSLTGAAANAEASTGISPRLVEAVAEAAVAGELAVVQSHLEAHTARGGSMAEALIHLIGGAAARLGEDWESDARDFMDVTIGLGTLQAAILAVSDPGPAGIGGRQSLLLGTTPGEDHTLGLAIVNHFFRQTDWSVTFMPYASKEELSDTVAQHWFEIAGLSVASESLVPSAAKTVAGLRRASQNPNLKIMVGGPLVRIDPSLGERIGADYAVSDGRRAVEWAQQWTDAGTGAGDAPGA